MKKHFSHGEVNGFSGGEIPSGAKKVAPQKGKYIVANSETTGNHHCVEAKEGVEMYEKDGILFLKNDVPADVFCVMEERHDRITLEPGIWEIDRSQEFDYLSGMKRAVAD